MTRRIDIGWIHEGYYTGDYVVDYFVVSEGPGAYQASMEFCLKNGYGGCPYWINQDGDSVVKYGGRPVDDFLKEFPDKKEEIEKSVAIYKQNRRKY